MRKSNGAHKIIAGVIVLWLSSAASATPPNWPSFRGPFASGVAKDDKPPTTWNVKTGENIKWKTPIPGLAHSSPIVWGDRVYLTTVVGEKPNPTLRVGLYGESPDNPEEFSHDYRLLALDAHTGEIIWQKTAYRGVPKTQRHIKSSHGNSTPATDGNRIIAFFGSEGLYCYATNGMLRWKKNLGLLDSGAFDLPEVQWGFGSSPIIHDDLVIVQCDVNNDSFISAFDLGNGRPIWRNKRDEQPGWGTPTIYTGGRIPQVIVNGYKHIGAYDARVGNVIWRMHGGGDIPVPTPIVAHDLIFITNAHGPQAPVYAIRTSAHGDITLPPGETSSAHIAWSYNRGGCYMQTPLVYGDLLYTCRNNGTLTCYEARTGEIKYRKRLGGGSTGFSASPVAVDGKIYFTSEEGDIHVIKAGPIFGLMAVNSMDEITMATPAIAHDTLYVRTQHHLYAIGKAGTATDVSETRP